MTAAVSLDEPLSVRRFLGDEDSHLAIFHLPEGHPVHQKRPSGPSHLMC